MDGVKASLQASGGVKEREGRGVKLPKGDTKEEGELV
jgi:hypothetical protein